MGNDGQPCSRVPAGVFPQLEPAQPAPGRGASAGLCPDQGPRTFVQEISPGIWGLRPSQLAATDHKGPLCPTAGADVLAQEVGAAGSRTEANTGDARGCC